MLTIPVVLEKRMTDQIDGFMRWGVFVVNAFRKGAKHLDDHRDKHFLLIGPFDTEADIVLAKVICEKAFKKGGK